MKVFRKCEVFYGPDNSIIKEMTLCNIDTKEVIQEEDRIAQKIDEPLVAYVGVVSMVQMVATPIGYSNIPVDLPFLIEASSLNEAFEKYPKMIEEIQAELHEQEEKMVEKIKKMREEQENKIYVPNQVESMQINSNNSKIII